MSSLMEEHFPEIAAETLVTYLMAAERYVQEAERGSEPLSVRRSLCSAHNALAAVDAVRRASRIGVLTEMQVNAALLNLRQRLARLPERTPGQDDQP